MPLDRAHVTVASRTMLPSYVALSLVFGLAYVTDPAERLRKAPSTTFQRDVMPLWVWGAIMLTIAALMVLAMLTGRRLLFAYALCCCALTWVLWGGAIATSIFLTDNTSFIAPALPWFVAVCCVASIRSLIVKEV